MLYKKYDLSNVKLFQKNSLFHPETTCFKHKKNTGLVIFNSLKQNKLVLNFFVNRNWKKLTASRTRTKVLAENRKSHHPIETLVYENGMMIEGNVKL